MGKHSWHVVESGVGLRRSSVEGVMVAVVKLSACHYSRLGKNARRGWLKVKVVVGDCRWRLGGTSVLVRHPNPSRKLGEWA